MCVVVVGFEDVEEAMDVCLSCCCFDFLFLFLVDPVFLAFLRISIKVSYCLDVILSFLSR